MKQEEKYHPKRWEEQKIIKDYTIVQDVEGDRQTFYAERYRLR